MELESWHQWLERIVHIREVRQEKMHTYRASWDEISVQVHLRGRRWNYNRGTNKQRMHDERVREGKRHHDTHIPTFSREIDDN